MLGTKYGFGPPVDFLGSEVCATKSADGPNPYFSLNIKLFCDLSRH